MPYGSVILVGKPQFKEQVRRDILRKRNRVRGGYGKIVPTPVPIRDPRKTFAMHLLELQHGRPVEELIAEGEIKDLGQTLGVDPSTISYWRKRLGLRE